MFALVVERRSKPSSRRDCRDPRHKDVKTPAIPGFWTPATPAGATSTTNANSDLNLLLYKLHRQVFNRNVVIIT
jgi:hypothetical protein